MPKNKHVKRKENRRRNPERHFKSCIRDLKETVLNANNISAGTKEKALEKILCFSKMAILLGSLKRRKTLLIPSLGIQIVKNEGIKIIKEK
jgi:hypothetical protein